MARLKEKGKKMRGQKDKKSCSSAFLPFHLFAPNLFVFFLWTKALA